MRLASTELKTLNQVDAVFKGLCNNNVHYQKIKLLHTVATALSVYSILLLKKLNHVGNKKWIKKIDYIDEKQFKSAKITDNPLTDR